MINEKDIMDIIIHGGDSRSASLQAIKAAREGDWGKVKELLNRSEESANRAHEVQTKLIQAEIRGETSNTTLLMVHAQDHLMNALTVKELATEMIEECKKRSELEMKVEELLK